MPVRCDSDSYSNSQRKVLLGTATMPTKVHRLRIVLFLSLQLLTMMFGLHSGSVPVIQLRSLSRTHNGMSAWARGLHTDAEILSVSNRGLSLSRSADFVSRLIGRYSQCESHPQWGFLIRKAQLDGKQMAIVISRSSSFFSQNNVLCKTLACIELYDLHSNSSWKQVKYLASTCKQWLG